MRKFIHGLVFAVFLSVCATAFLFTLHGQGLEERIGLSFLYSFRGPRHPPDEVVIINIDDRSSARLGLADRYDKWPRSIHGKLVDKLSWMGAEVIVFDVYFREERKVVDDQSFADAISRAGNVILAEQLQHDSFGHQQLEIGSGQIEMDVLVPPIQNLSDVSLALAPFPLPKLPVRLDNAWLFKSSSGGIPTLPVVAYQTIFLTEFNCLRRGLQDISPSQRNLLSKNLSEALVEPGLVEIMRTMRFHYEKNSEDGSGYTSTKGYADLAEMQKCNPQRLAQLVDLYSGADQRYLDFYGPPATISTFTYWDILGKEQSLQSEIAEKIKGAAVFIGAARVNWSNQKDGFFTVYSQKNGLDISGVEVAATLFSNLYENRSVVRVNDWRAVLLICLVAILSSLICFMLRPVVALVTLTCCVGAILFISLLLFSRGGLWLPLVTPVGIIPLATTLGGFLHNFVVVEREKTHIGKALGYYLPESAVKELTRDLTFISKGEKRVYATCLLTDAQNYTTLSERMAPEELSQHLKKYYQYLFRQVKESDGIVGNIIADSMLAMWPASGPDILKRNKGCLAALKILNAVELFNAKYPDSALPTRIGLHAGYLIMDNIGAEDHYEYAPVGDIVNTASRIEGLNKHLSTQILASEEALGDVEGVGRRELGMFLLGGKTKPVKIYELYDHDDRKNEQRKNLDKVFRQALTVFQAGDWQEASRLFEECRYNYQDDGPARFYHRLCQKYQEIPPPDEMKAVVRMEK